MNTELLVDYVAPHLHYGDRIHPEQLRRIAQRNGLPTIATEWHKQDMAGMKITIEDLAIDDRHGYGFIAAIRQMAAMANTAGLEIHHPQPRSPMLAQETIQGNWSYQSYIIY